MLSSLKSPSLCPNSEVALSESITDANRKYKAARAAANNTCICQVGYKVWVNPLWVAKVWRVLGELCPISTKLVDKRLCFY